MILKKIICTACAVVTAFSCMAASAFAADESAEKEPIKFEYTKSMVTTEENVPAVSFDGDDWDKYVHITPDASKVGLNMSIDKTTFYQGFSLKVTASGSQKDELFLNAGYVRDADNNPAYPGASEEGAKFICPGVELRCEDFGLTCFDGCLFSFNYRMGSESKGKLMGDSVFAFGTDEGYTNNYGVIQIKYDDLLDNNVTQYRLQMVSVPPNSSCTKLVFEIPVLDKIDSDVFTIDNIIINLPETEDGKPLYIKSLDGYNANAQPQETIEALQIGEKKESRAEIGSTIEKQEGGNGFIVVIIIVVAVISAGVGGFFFFRKKKKFY